MTQILGTLTDSAGVGLSGKLKVQLSAPLVNEAVSPDSIYYPIEELFTITSGTVNITLPQTETAGITYEFSFYTVTQQIDYYFADGTQYFGPTHQHTDTFYYTGTYHDTSSVRLSRTATDVLSEVEGAAFKAIVPNIPTVDFAQLVPTGFSRDRLASGARQIANLIAFDATYSTAIGNAVLQYMGDWSAGTYYQPRQWVTYDGGSWYSKYPQPQAGNTPVVGSAYWAPLSLRGNNGTGTAGNDAVYSAAGWDGQTDAPSRNAVRDIIELLARANNAALTGTPTAPTAAQGTNTIQIATCAFAIAEIVARLAAATFTTQTNTASDTNPATTAFVKNVFHRYGRIAESQSSGVNAGSSVAGINTRALNTTVNNAGDIVNLASSTFTLRAGTYRIHASAPGCQCGAHRAFLWNVTSGIRTLNGTSENSAQAANIPTTRSFIQGTFTIAANTDFQIRHYTQVAQAAFGLGIAVSEASQSEIYTDVQLWRLD